MSRNGRIPQTHGGGSPAVPSGTEATVPDRSIPALLGPSFGVLGCWPLLGLPCSWQALWVAPEVLSEVVGGAMWLVGDRRNSSEPPWVGVLSREGLPWQLLMALEGQRGTLASGPAGVAARAAGDNGVKVSTGNCAGGVSWALGSQRAVGGGRGAGG